MRKPVIAYGCLANFIGVNALVGRFPYSFVVVFDEQFF